MTRDAIRPITTRYSEIFTTNVERTLSLRIWQLKTCELKPYRAVLYRLPERNLGANPSADVR